MNITSGKIKNPIRAVAYGPEGWGKTTFAAAWPTPLFIDVENSTQSLDVARTPRPTSWAMLTAMVEELTKDANSYETIIIDTVDWAERLAKESICAKAKVAAIGDVDYGKLYQQLDSEWRKFLDNLSQLAEKQNCHILLLAHSCLTRVDIPEETGAIDRYEMKLTHSFKINLSQSTKEWATLVIHLGYETIVQEIDGKNKAQGGTRRIIHTAHHACWDAKQRSGYDLPETLRCELADPVKEFRKLFSPPEKKEIIPPPVKKTEPTPSPVPEKKTETEKKAETVKPPHMQQLDDLMAMSGVSVTELQHICAKRGHFPIDTPISNYGMQFVNGKLIAHWEQVEKLIKAERGN
jgi:hypothetical protein